MHIYILQKNAQNTKKSQYANIAKKRDAHSGEIVHFSTKTKNPPLSGGIDFFRDLHLKSRAAGIP